MASRVENVTDYECNSSAMVLIGINQMVLYFIQIISFS